jgi:hypothetical protein
VERRIDPTELRNDEIHRRVAALIRRDPTVIAEAAAALARWLSQPGVEPLPAWLEWKTALAMLDPPELAAFLESRTPRARRMRISSPFFVLAEKAR